MSVRSSSQSALTPVTASTFRAMAMISRGVDRSVSYWLSAGGVMPIAWANVAEVMLTLRRAFRSLSPKVHAGVIPLTEDVLGIGQNYTYLNSRARCSTENR